MARTQPEPPLPPAPDANVDSDAPPPDPPAPLFARAFAPACAAPVVDAAPEPAEGPAEPLVRTDAVPLVGDAPPTTPPAPFVQSFAITGFWPATPALATAPLVIPPPDDPPCPVRPRAC